MKAISLSAISGERATKVPISFCGPLNRRAQRKALAFGGNGGAVRELLKHAYYENIP
jgi:hypothetical protein